MVLDVRAAREFVATVLADLDYSGDVETVLLLVSELATNAVRHARTEFEVAVDVQPGVVRVSVVDSAGAAPPVVREPDAEQTDGRGLFIVDRLATTWGTLPVPTGRKAVWFTVA